MKNRQLQRLYYQSISDLVHILLHYHRYRREHTVCTTKGMYWYKCTNQLWHDTNQEAINYLSIYCLSGESACSDCSLCPVRQIVAVIIQCSFLLISPHACARGKVVSLFVVYLLSALILPDLDIQASKQLVSIT